MSHFYLTLPSNSSRKYFPQNTLTEYQTRLKSSVSLDGDWEVGMVEMTFPKTWHTINDGSIGLIVLPVETPVRFVTLHINTGYYETVTHIVSEINTAIERFMRSDLNGKRTNLEEAVATYFRETGTPAFSYSNIKKRVVLQLPSKVRIKFEVHLAAILGFDDEIENVTDAAKKLIGPMACDITGGLQSLLVYSDILQNVVVGDTEAPLLRIVHASGRHGDVIVRYYDRPQYVPLQKKHFDTIGIYIKSDLGQNILFESGKVVITLHFRKAFSKYLL